MEIPEMMNMIYIYGIFTLRDWSNYVDDNYTICSMSGIFGYKTGMILPNIWKIENVPNHQPEMYVNKHEIKGIWDREEIFGKYTAIQVVSPAKRPLRCH